MLDSDPLILCPRSRRWCYHGRSRTPGEAPVIHRFLLPLLALSMATPVLATFELKDPAAEIYAEEQAVDAISERVCFDFLVDSVEDPESYRVALDRVESTIGDERSAAIIEEALRTFCVDHPKATLGQAARALGGAVEAPAVE